jgi:hypothetical protein
MLYLREIGPQGLGPEPARLDLVLVDESNKIPEYY